uniref:Uncharacterized protein n=1 Tax=Adineta vaga TaxID=104782 RepID=B3G488_ADIVA|nr:unknown [Adineta vaga]
MILSSWSLAMEFFLLLGLCLWITLVTCEFECARSPRYSNLRAFAQSNDSQHNRRRRQTETAEACYFMAKIDLFREEYAIDFSDSTIYDKGTKNNYIQVLTTVTLDQDPLDAKHHGFIRSELFYSCTSTSRCTNMFGKILKNSMTMLSKFDLLSTLSIDKFQQLLVKKNGESESNKFLHCFIEDSNKTIECKHGLCFANLASEHDQTCMTDEGKKYNKIQIKFDIISNSLKIDKNIFPKVSYTCNTDYCNSPSTIKQIKDLAGLNSYDFNNLMKKLKLTDLVIAGMGINNMLENGGSVDDKFFDFVSVFNNIIDGEILTMIINQIYYSLLQNLVEKQQLNRSCRLSLIMTKILTILTKLVSHYLRLFFSVFSPLLSSFNNFFFLIYASCVYIPQAATCFSIASSNASTTSSGYTIQTSTNINPNYRCYWLNSCQGNHELRSCSHWREELRGKLGIYYPSNGTYRRFSRDNLSGANLEHNPTGCTTVHLLIYTIRSDGMKEILFGLSNRRENHHDSTRRPLLSFPFSKPCKRREPGLNITRRAFKWISDDETIARQDLKSYFLFQHANVIYPWYVTNEQANLLTNNFQANEELISLH